MPLPTGCVLLRSVVRCSLWVVGKSGERALSRVLLRTVESGAWRVMREIESSLRSREDERTRTVLLFLALSLNLVLSRSCERRTDLLALEQPLLPKMESVFGKTKSQKRGKKCSKQSKELSPCSGFYSSNRSKSTSISLIPVSALLLLLLSISCYIHALRE